MAGRIVRMAKGKPCAYDGLVRITPNGARWTGKVVLDEDKLKLPLRWKKPRRIFVDSMSDLFHEALPDDAIDQVFSTMILAEQHTYLILTKHAAPGRVQASTRSRPGVPSRCCAIRRDRPLDHLARQIQR
jgi:protein gp37